MSSEEEAYCERCNIQTEETLVLPCGHNFCLSCAAKILKEQNKTNYYYNQIIKCDICQSKNELEADTVREILEREKENTEENNLPNYNYNNTNNNQNYDLINENNENENENDYVNIEEENKINKVNKKIQNKKNQINKSINSNRNNNNNNKNIENNNISTSELNIINELTNNNFKQLCKEHSEPLTYLCLDCMSNCICTECVVHGIHKNHEVLNIRNAYPLISKKLEDLSKYANDQKKSITLVNEAVSKKKRLINTLIDRCKNEIHNTFEQIKLRLDNKEKEIINNSTSILHKNIDELNKYDNVLKQNSDTLEEIIEKINIVLRKKEDLNTINYFCENRNKILKQCEIKDINSIPDLDSFTNFKIEPNRLTLNNMLEGINNFHFDIASIKGFESNNRKRNQNIKKIPKLQYKQSNSNFDNINGGNILNRFNNMNDNINNNSMYTNMANPNINNAFMNQMPNNYMNYHNKRPRTAKPSKRRRIMNTKKNINNIQNYPINLNQNIENIQNDLNQNLENFKNDLNQNIEDNEMFGINNAFY